MLFSLGCLHQQNPLRLLLQYYSKDGFRSSFYLFWLFAFYEHGELITNQLNYPRKTDHEATDRQQ